MVTHHHQVSPFGRMLAWMRRQAGYTQEALADELGVKRTTVWRWENGLSEPELPMLFLLAKVLKTTPLALMPALGVPVDARL